MTASSNGGHGPQVKIVIQRVRLGTEEFRVIRPAEPLDNGALYDTGREYSMYVDRADGRRIGALWLLAARSPRSLVYLPMRATPPAPDTDTDWSQVGGSPERPLDLVLLHHSLQFAPSRWKRVRERLTAANAPREIRTARMPASSVPTEEEIDYRAMDYQDNKDALRQHSHADTLFLTGSATPFRESARHFFTVAKEGPPQAAGPLYIPGACNYHLCRCLDWPKRDLPDQQIIHIEYTPRWTRR